MLGAVLSDVLGVQPLRQHVVELNRAAGPGAADGVLQLEVELRRIEGAVAFGNLRFDARGAGGVQHRGFRLVPELLRTGALFRARAEIDVIALKAEIGMDG